MQIDTFKTYFGGLLLIFELRQQKSVFEGSLNRYFNARFLCVQNSYASLHS